jgi:group I intron endonuclease
MSKYENGKIYKILNSVDGEVYVGSTIEPLCKRMYKHRHDSNKRTHYPLYQHMNKLGRDNFYIELIEKCNCSSKEELLAKEGEWIRNIGTLNAKIAGRTRNQWQQDNHERRMVKAKVYRDAHKEEGKAYHKQRYEQNKNEINAKAREQMTCTCGAVLSTGNYQRHLKSLKHKQLMEQLSSTME